MTDLVTSVHADGVSTITMDDGKANVMSRAMISAILSSLDHAEERGDVVVLRGRDGMFSAGYDLAMFQQSGEEIVATLRAGGELVHRLLGFPRPTLAVATGHGIAQGSFVLLSCDVRVGVAGTAKFGLNEVAIGLTIPHYGVEVARHRMQATAFDRMLNTGPLVGTDEAMRAGILDQVADDLVDLEGRVQRESARLLSLDAAAHTGTKLRTRAHVLTAVRDGIDVEWPA